MFTEHRIIRPQNPVKDHEAMFSNQNGGESWKKHFDFRRVIGVKYDIGLIILISARYIERETPMNLCFIKSVNAFNRANNT